MVGMSTAYSGVIIGGTRIIYDGNKKESSISIKNPDSNPYLIQSWVESLNGKSTTPPFIITPPLYRLDKGQQNIERVILTGTLPQNKESLFWVNIKAIPSAPRKENTLQIAVKTQIKLIYRPGSLKGESPDDLVDKLKWTRSGNYVQVTNPTPYVINFNEIAVGGKKIDNVSYVLPDSTERFVLPRNVNGGTLTFTIITDYGNPGKIHNTNI